MLTSSDDNYQAFINQLCNQFHKQIAFHVHKICVLWSRKWNEWYKNILIKFDTLNGKEQCK